MSDLTLKDSTTIPGADKPSSLSSLSESLGSIVKAVAPSVAAVATAKYTAQAAQYQAQIPAQTETGQRVPAIASTGFDWKSPGVIAAIVAGVLLLGVLIFRRR